MILRGCFSVLLPAFASACLHFWFLLSHFFCSLTILHLLYLPFCLLAFCCSTCLCFAFLLVCCCALGVLLFSLAAYPLLFFPDRMHSKHSVYVYMIVYTFTVCKVQFSVLQFLPCIYTSWISPIDRVWRVDFDCKQSLCYVKVWQYKYIYIIIYTCSKHTHTHVYIYIYTYVNNMHIKHTIFQEV